MRLYVIGYWDKVLTRCCTTLSVELNIAEPLLIFGEYGRLDMVKLIVRIFRWCPIVVRRRDVGRTKNLYDIRVTSYSHHLGFSYSPTTSHSVQSDQNLYNFLTLYHT